MLINTVVLFIRDTLPIFLLISLLMSSRMVANRILFAAVLVSLMGAVFCYLNLSLISELRDGAGFELLKIAMLMVAWLALVLSVWFRYAQRPYVFSVCFLVGALILPNAINFLVYSVAYWPTQKDAMEILVGIVIGLGITFSLACVIYLILSLHASKRAGYTLLLLFCSGQIAPVTILLEQVDYLPSQPWLWDTRFLVEDNSEYGHLLNALIGYEATPGYLYIAVYAMVLVAPWCTAKIYRVLRKAPIPGERQK